MRYRGKGFLIFLVLLALTACGEDDKELEALGKPELIKQLRLCKLGNAVIRAELDDCNMSLLEEIEACDQRLAEARRGR